MNKEVMVSWMESGMIHVPNLLLENYRKMGLDEKELTLLLQIYSFLNQGIDFPTPEQLSNRMTMTSTETSTMLRKLVQHQFLSIEEGIKDDIRYEKYSLKPLWMRLAEDMLTEAKQSNLEHKLINDQDLYTLFEQEFGRPLSPIECENLAMWMDVDGQDATIIKAALREAVLSGKLNFRYIDRILFEWKKNGIRTVEQARKQGEKFRQRNKKPPSSNQPVSSSVPFYNWLEQ